MTRNPEHFLAFLLVQHLDPVHESFLTEILAKRAAFTVETAADGATLTANLPEQLGSLRAVLQDDHYVGRLSESRSYLEDPDRIRVALCIKDQVARHYRQRRGRSVEAGCDRCSSNIRGQGQS
jgi:hypothetical protein